MYTHTCTYSIANNSRAGSSYRVVELRLETIAQKKERDRRRRKKGREDNRWREGERRRNLDRKKEEERREREREKERVKEGRTEKGKISTLG